ncbi:MAG: Crp/Fnr family transcriptional regulator [Firmicutes bacterium]|nr:Crp/Fnr family transcriptional regulator [Bacillota bacterium]
MKKPANPQKVDKMDTMDNAKFLSQISLFLNLPYEEVARAAAIIQERVYRKGSPIFFEGDPGEAMFIIKEGAVKVYRLSIDGKEKTLAIISRGGCFGEMSLLDGLPRSAAAQALEDSKLLILPREDFLKLLTSNPQIALKIIRVLTARLREADQQIEYLAFGDARGRVASILLDLFQKHAKLGPDGYTIDIRLTHQELANLSGVTRETASRILSEFEEDGLIRIQGRNILISSEKGLRCLISF